MGGEEDRAILDATRRTVTFEHRWWMRTSLWIALAALTIVGLRVAWYLRSRRVST